MGHAYQPLMEYKYEQLMDQLNEFCIALKIHLHQDQIDKNELLPKLLSRYPKPSVQEIDNVHLRIHHILMQDAKPMRHY